MFMGSRPFYPTIEAACNLHDSIHVVMDWIAKRIQDRMQSHTHASYHAILASHCSLHPKSPNPVVPTNRLSVRDSGKTKSHACGNNGNSREATPKHQQPHLIFSLSPPPNPTPHPPPTTTFTSQTIPTTPRQPIDPPTPPRTLIARPPRHHEARRLRAQRMELVPPLLLPPPRSQSRVPELTTAVPASWCPSSPS